MKPAVAALCAAAERAVRDGHNILVLSDRATDADHVPIPALLATAAVHHHLVRMGLRTESGLVVETGAAREVHHFAVLAGYGAEAINPYLAFDAISALRPTLPEKTSEAELHKRYIKSVCKGLLKVMSKMGISAYQSYCGAQIFDAVGLASEFVDTYFAGTASRIEGVGLQEIAEESVRWHRDAFGANPIYEGALDVGGDYAFRIRGEAHAWTPDSIAKLQHATRANDWKTYEDFSRTINEQSERLLTLRGLFELHLDRQPVPLEEVEPAKEIVRRFATGAMSFGSISYEAHTNLAIAMNRIGGSRTRARAAKSPSASSRCPTGRRTRRGPRSSRWPPAASGDHRVLVNADELQIKMAQGAKPGEGGQLPGHKVSKQIARVRHSTPGVGLISPPPHHDIYSIETWRS